MWLIRTPFTEERKHGHGLAHTARYNDSVRSQEGALPPVWQTWPKEAEVDPDRAHGRLQNNCLPGGHLRRCRSRRPTLLLADLATVSSLSLPWKVANRAVARDVLCFSKRSTRSKRRSPCWPRACRSSKPSSRVPRRTRQTHPNLPLAISSSLRSPLFVESASVSKGHSPDIVAMSDRCSRPRRSTRRGSIAGRGARIAGDTFSRATSHRGPCNKWTSCRVRSRLASTVAWLATARAVRRRTTPSSTNQ